MHSIKKLDVELKLSADLSKNTAMDEAKDLYEGFFHDAIERAVVSFPEDEDLIVDNIEIDLGALSPSDVPDALERKLIDELSRRMMRHTEAQEGVEAGRYSTGHAGSIVPAAGSYSQMRAETMEKTFLKYLSSGYADMSILGVHYTSKDLCADVFREVLTSPDSVGRVVSVLKGSMSAFFRFIDIVEDEDLNRVVGQMWPEWRRSLPTIEGMTDSIRLLAFVLLYSEPGSPGSPDNGSASSVNASIELWRKAAKVKEGESAMTASGILERVRTDYSTYCSSSKAVQLLRELLTQCEANGIAPTSSSSSPSPAIPSSSNYPFTNTPSRESSPLYTEVGHKTNTSTGLPMERTESGEDRDGSVACPTPVFESGVRIHLDDAGLVLLAPFFKQLFQSLQYLNDRSEFLTPILQAHAVHILRFIAAGSLDSQMEENLVLEKALCGLPFDFPSGVDFKMSSREYEEVEKLHSTVLKYWNPFKEKSVNSLRQAFLMRHGTIERDEASWIVRVEGQGLDILMDGIPWGYSIVSLPWAGLFYIDWQ